MRVTFYFLKKIINLKLLFAPQIVPKEGTREL